VVNLVDIESLASDLKTIDATIVMTSSIVVFVEEIGMARFVHYALYSHMTTIQ